MKKIGIWIAILALMAATTASAEIREAPPVEAPAVHAKAAETSYWGDLGYGSLCVITNLFYMPVKLVYAAVGIPVGGLAYVLTAGDTQISDSIWSAALGGDYVVTPRMLAGDSQIAFNGRDR